MKKRYFMLGIVTLILNLLICFLNKPFSFRITTNSMIQ